MSEVGAGGRKSYDSDDATRYHNTTLSDAVPKLLPGDHIKLTVGWEEQITHEMMSRTFHADVVGWRDGSIEIEPTSHRRGPPTSGVWSIGPHGDSAYCQSTNFPFSVRTIWHWPASGDETDEDYVLLDGGQFWQQMHALAATRGKARLSIDSTALATTVEDPARVMLFSASVPVARTQFQGEITVNTRDIRAALGELGPYPVYTLEIAGDEHVALVGGSDAISIETVESSEVPGVATIDAEHFEANTEGVPALKFVGALSAMARAIPRQADVSVRVATTEDGIVFSTDGGNLDLEWSVAIDADLEAGHTTTYSSDYLADIGSALPTAGTVTLRYGTEDPLGIEYGNGAAVYLAPRITQ